MNKYIFVMVLCIKDCFFYFLTKLKHKKEKKFFKFALTTVYLYLSHNVTIKIQLLSKKDHLVEVLLKMLRYDIKLNKKFNVLGTVADCLKT